MNTIWIHFKVAYNYWPKLVCFGPFLWFLCSYSIVFCLFCVWARASFGIDLAFHIQWYSSEWFILLLFWPKLKYKISIWLAKCIIPFYCLFRLFELKICTIIERGLSYFWHVWKRLVEENNICWGLSTHLYLFVTKNWA